MSYTTILLSGSLAQRFGRQHSYHLDSGTTKEAFSALKNTVDGFEQFIKQQSKKGIRYAIFRNRENITDQDITMAGTREVRIVPVVDGSKRAGVLQTVLGVAIIAAAAIATGGVGAAFAAGAGAWGTAASVGLAMTIGGVVQMISPQQKGISAREASENSPSYAFGGAVNTTASGHIVGIGYGERIIGGAVISAGIYAEDIA
ncbi:tail assembly protein [Vibrio injensis]|uniref:tail assembly protein n=1 Tax=Vibrio injensis TaxID=1307414 RepID=UPI0009325DD6|nr:tail assembly protein [Vibrio injensis]